MSAGQRQSRGPRFFRPAQPAGSAGNGRGVVTTGSEDGFAGADPEERAEPEHDQEEDDVLSQLRPEVDTLRHRREEPRARAGQDGTEGEGGEVPPGPLRGA